MVQCAVLVGHGMQGAAALSLAWDNIARRWCLLIAAEAVLVLAVGKEQLTQIPH